MVNPVRVLRLFVYPNLIAASLASSAVIMYSLLTSIRYPGLFYLARGTGYLVGTLVGGRYADYVVKTWTRKRDGVRVPEDRLRSVLPFMGDIIPPSVLVYGWGIEKEAGEHSAGIGVGWFSTITAPFLIVSTAAMLATIWLGKRWREEVGKWSRAKRLAEQSVARKELSRRANEA
ncbi:hypothetical protein C8A03DRAFT_30397 [Achaetomium macrosporum]|uniref:Uncharacterized protein n=1 Tax=Achaetomium macrosporum TaxID=79813 RepID=A0AAN7CGY4_9PEZI|nr:hypothetical protein C8A03DRAFT_30397 [Achaetomium macrosporum]